MPTITERLNLATEKAELASGIMERFANDGDTSVIETAGGQIPSIAKFIKDEKAIVEGQVAVIFGSIVQYTNDAQAAAADAALAAQNAAVSMGASAASANAAATSAGASGVSAVSSASSSSSAAASASAAAISAADADTAKDQAVIAKVGAEAAEAQALINSQTYVEPLREILSVKLTNNWSEVTTGISMQARCMAYSPELNIFAAGASGGAYTKLAYSSDGETWVAGTHPLTPDITCIIWVADLSSFFATNTAFSSSGGLYMSTDGINWTDSALPASFSARSICWSPELSLFVCVGVDISGNSGSIITSADGVTWARRFTSATYKTMHDIAWSAQAGMFVAICRDDEDRPVFYSSNGIVWSQAVSSPITSQVMESVCWSSSIGKFCIVGDYNPSGTVSGRSLTSDDGVIWSSTSAPFHTEQQWINVIAIDDLGVFIACGVTAFGTPEQNVAVSRDGMNWTAPDSGANNNYYCMAWSLKLSRIVSLGAEVLTGAISGW